LLLWDIKAGALNRMEVMLVAGTLIIAEAMTMVAIAMEAIAVAIVQHLF